MIEEGIMAADITEAQVINICLPQHNEITHIDVCWQDELTMNLDLSLMYILSGQQEIQDYVNQTSKPEINNYVQEYARPIVADVVEKVAAPTISEYFEGTVKTSISEFVEKEMAGYAQIASSSAQEATEISNRMNITISEFNSTSYELLNKAEQGVSHSTENVANSKIWAEGSDSEVGALNGEHSSKGWASEAEKSALEAKQQADNVSGAITIIEGSIGDIGFTPLGIDETQNKRRYLNGQVISQAQFVSFTNKIKSTIKLNPSIATTETNWQAEVTNSPYGICGKFVIDDALGTIRLPKYPDWSIREVGEAPVVGNGKILGLTTGNGDGGLTHIQGYWFGGAAETNVNIGSSVSNGGDTKFPTFKAVGVSTNSNNSGLISKLNNANTEDKLQGKWFIQVATGVEESVDVTREIELNNPFSLLDYKWSEYELNNASWLISNGSFHSGSTYASVYELLFKIYNGAKTKDGVSVKLSTEAYEDTDFVLNTADTTFRLPIKVKLASGNAVVGNNTPIYLTNGTDTAQFASSSGNNTLVLHKNSNANIGQGMGGNAWTNSGTLGLTTDPTKSGIETSSLGLKLYFYVGETIQDANVIAASNVLTDIANIGSRPHIVETYQNGNSWYRIWSDGWCEQGGLLHTNGGGTHTVSYLKPLKKVATFNGVVSSTWAGGLTISHLVTVDAVYSTYFVKYLDSNFAYFWWEAKGYIA